MAEDDNIVPLRMTAPMALRMIRNLSEDSGRIVVIGHGRKRQKERKITRPQIEFCLRKGFIDEGPFMNEHGNWQCTMCCQHAGDELTVVVAIDWPSRLIVITTY